MADHNARHADPTIEAERLMYPDDAAHVPLDTPAPAAAPPGIFTSQHIGNLQAQLDHYQPGAFAMVTPQFLAAIYDSHEALRAALSEARAERDDWEAWAHHLESCPICTDWEAESLCPDGELLEKACRVSSEPAT